MFLLELFFLINIVNRVVYLFKITYSFRSGIMKMHRFQNFLLTILTLMVLLPAVTANAVTKGLGPFDLPPLGSSEFFREMPAFIAPTVNDTSRLRFTLSTRILNNWTYNIETDSEEPYLWDGNEDYPFKHGSFLNDMEIYTAIPRFSYNIGNNFHFETIIPIVYQDGGFLDQTIEEFHETFGLGQHHRTDWDRNQIHLVYIHPDGETSSDYDGEELRGGFLGNIITGGSWHTDRFLLPFCFRLLLTLPTSETPVTFDEGGHYLTFQSSFYWSVENLVFYHGAGITHFENSESHGLNLEKIRYSGLTTIECRLNDRLSFLVHMVAASAVADYPELDKPVVEMTLGLKGKVGPGIIELGIIENLFFFDNSPDIGIHLGYSLPLF